MNKPNKLTDKEIQQIIKNVKVTLAVENMFVESVEEEIVRRLLKGEMTEEEALNLLIKSN